MLSALWRTRQAEPVASAAVGPVVQASGGSRFRGRGAAAGDARGREPFDVPRQCRVEDLGLDAEKDASQRVAREWGQALV